MDAFWRETHPRDHPAASGIHTAPAAAYGAMFSAAIPRHRTERLAKAQASASN